MSDSNRIVYAYRKETTYGTGDGSGNAKTGRFLSDSLSPGVGYIQSQELRSDRQIADVIRNDINAGGAWPFEWSYGSFDDLLVGAFLSSGFSSVVTISGTVYSCAASGNKIHRSSGDFTASSLAVGQWIRVNGFTTNGTSFYVKITLIETADLTVSGKTLVNEAAGATIEIEQGAQIVNGTTFQSFALERQYADLGSVYSQFLGMVVDGFDLAVAPDQIVTGSFGFIGKKEQSNTSSLYTIDAAGTNAVMNGIDHVGAFFENYTALTDLTAFNIALANNHRLRKVIGTLGASSVGTGTVGLTGGFRAYFSSAALFNKLLADTATAFAMRFVDAAGNAIVIDMPQVKFTSGQRVGGGINTDVFADMQYQAYRDPTEGITIRLQKWDV